MTPIDWKLLEEVLTVTLDDVDGSPLADDTY